MWPQEGIHYGACIDQLNLLRLARFCHGHDGYMSNIAVVAELQLCSGVILKDKGERKNVPHG